MDTASTELEHAEPGTSRVMEQRRTTRESHPLDQHLTVIEASSGWRLLNLDEMWRFRELLFTLVWRDVQVRYKQTVLGAAWAIIQPLAQMVVFTIFFGKMAEVPHSNIPYSLFAFAGLLPWTFFANAVAASAGSVVSNQNLISKIYFPRLFIPGSAIGVSMVDFAVGFLVLAGLMIFYSVNVSLQLLYLPFLMLGMAAAAFGVGTLISALTVAYRDFRHVVPFLVQLWMFATPTVFMDTAHMGSRWARILPLNPMYGLILNFRYSIVGRALDWNALATSLGMTVLVLLLGCLYFRRVEKHFADII